jgi:hypothetical protein
VPLLCVCVCVSVDMCDGFLVFSFSRHPTGTLGATGLGGRALDADNGVRTASAHFPLPSPSLSCLYALRSSPQRKGAPDNRQTHG